MKRIVLAYSYGFDNPGDYAITPGTINAIRSVDEKTYITVVSSGNRTNEKYLRTKDILESRYERLEVIPNDLFSSKEKKSAFNKINTLAKIVFNKNMADINKESQVRKRFEASDLLIFNGGHIFFWDKLMGEKRNIIKNYFLVSKIARNMGLNYGIYANSFGPYEFGWNIGVKSLFRTFFNKASFLFARDAHSRQYLKPLDLHHEVKTVLDPAFYLKDEEPEQVEKFIADHKLIENKFICFSFRLSNRGSVSGLPSQRERAYTNHLKHVLTYALKNTDYPLLLIKQVERDEADMKKVLAEVEANYDESRIIFVDGLDAGFLRSLYEKSRFIVAMRFHSLIFALSNATPVIGISYREIGPKIKGLLKQFSIEENFFSLDDFNQDQFDASFKKTVKESDKYRGQLKSTLKEQFLHSENEIRNFLEK